MPPASNFGRLLYHTGKFKNNYIVRVLRFRRIFFLTPAEGGYNYRQKKRGRRYMLKAILFDFGGVLAEEGFRNGLKEIARKHGLDQDLFYERADELIQETGYLTGAVDESVYWRTLKEKTGIRGSDADLREEILKRFVLRPRMISCVDRMRSRGFLTALVSDQTNWLDEFDGQTSLFRHFDRVFNSFTMGRSKRDALTFGYVCDMLRVKPEETIFIDDNAGHVGRAASAGMRTILFTTFDEFANRIQRATGMSCIT
jgi:putative hydrolase of the HAD superfamily